MKLLLTALLVVTASLARQTLVAADAAFSGDGQHVYCIVTGKLVIEDIVIKPKEPGDNPTFDLTGSLAKGDRLVSIVRIDDGKFLLATNRALYRWKPGTDPEKIEAAPEGHKISDAAVSISPSITLTPTLTDTEENQMNALFLRRPGDDKLMSDESLPVSMLSPVFDSGGKMFFGIDSALYAGVWTGEKDEPVSLIAWPLVPLDVDGLDNGTSTDQLTVTGIAAAGKWLYVTLGSDVDALFVRLPKPVFDAKSTKPANEASATRKQRWIRFSKVLTTVEVIGSEDQPYFTSMRALCASPDGGTVFYSGVPMLHTNREEYWTRNVKTGEQSSLGDRPLEQ